MPHQSCETSPFTSHRSGGEFGSNSVKILIINPSQDSEPAIRRPLLFIYYVDIGTYIIQVVFLVRFLTRNIKKYVNKFKYCTLEFFRHFRPFLRIMGAKLFLDLFYNL